MTIEKARTLFRGDRDDLGGLVRRLSDTLTIRGQRAFRRAVLDAVDGNPASGWDDLTIHIDELFSIYEQAYQRAGRTESAILGQFDIDNRNPRVVRHLRERSATLITQIDDDTREAVRVVLSRGTASGLQPEQLADRIGRVVGLTPRDVLAVENLRSGLVRQGISNSRVDRMTKTYANRLLDARALVIARTEVVDAIESARQEVWEQAVAAGLVLSKDIWRVWVTADDERVCPICNPLDGARARLHGTFTKGGQSARRPPAHPNCRCEIHYEIAGFRVKKHGDTHDEKSHGNWARNGGSIPGTNETPGEFGPGEMPIPEGTTRLYHYTGAVGVVDIIAEEGFKIGSAKGETYGEPNAMWFSRQMPEVYAKEFVEVALPKEMTDRAIVGGIAYEKSDISLGFDIGPEYIISIHKPWYGHYRYIKGDDLNMSRMRADITYNDFLLDDPEYGPAIQLVKDEIQAEVGKHAGPGPHPGTGSPQTVHGDRGVRPMGTRSPYDDSNWAFAFENAEQLVEVSVPGARAIVTDTVVGRSFGYEEVRLEGLILDDGDRPIGSFIRSLKANGTVSMDKFFLEEGSRGFGYGYALLEAWEDSFAEAGFVTSEVRAIDIGRYAWAKWGYGWDVFGNAFFRTYFAKRITAGDPVALSLKERFPNEEFEPWDVAFSPGGKEFLLNGPNWNGFRHLTDLPAVTKRVDFHSWMMKEIDGDFAKLENDDPEFMAAARKFLGIKT